MRSLGALILAAGSGSRMGRTKQLLQLNGQSLVRRAVVAALDARCGPVVVVTGADTDAVSAELSDLPVQTAFNPDWSAGIGSSIRRGVSSLLDIDPALEAAMILLCDQPHLTSKVLEDLIRAWSASQNPMAACAYSKTLGPPCCFARSMFDQLLNIADTDGAKRLLLSDLSKVTSIPWPEGSEDLDTPQDLDRLNEGLAARGRSPAS